MKTRIILSLLPFLSALIFCGCQNRQLYKETRLQMGTFTEVVSPSKEAGQIVFDEIGRVENLLSKYKDNSEISRLNREGKLKVSPETYFILKKSCEFWKASEGAFDITIAPLMDIWGFTDKNFRQPNDEEIKKALQFVGSEKIIFDDKNNTVEFAVPGMKLDLGAIAKGFALDCAVKKLKENNIKSCLLNLGGQVYCLGQRFGRPWRINIRNPRGKEPLDLIELTDKGISTSGDYEKYFIKNKTRFCHIMNPKTGYPAKSGIISVSVIAPDNLTADALSTSVFVLGKEKGEALLHKFPGASAEISEEKNAPDN